MPGPTILIVEDEGILAAHLQDLLRVLGYTAAAPLATGEAAVSTVAAHPPDLVLMDIELAGQINGIAAAERIRSVQDVPIVFLTAYAQDPLLQQAKAAAPYGYLVKPVAERELAATLEMALCRHALDQKLKASETRYRTLVENVPGAVCCREGQTSWRVKYVSEGVLGVTGRSAEEFMEGRTHWRPLVLPEDQPMVDRVVQGAILRDDSFAVEYRIHRPEGGIRWVREIGRRTLSRIGESVHLDSVIVDITDRKRAEREREALIAELEAQKAELEQFLYTVSHDLKCPLITIRGFAGVLSEELGNSTPESVRLDLNRISNAAEKLGGLLDDLVELSRIGRLTHPSEDTPLEEIALRAAELLQGKLAERNVSFDVRKNLPVIHGDRIRLVEVLQNLIDNAVKYMGDEHQPRVEVGARQNGDETVCYVRDNGIGIESCYHERIFGLFDQLDPKSQGSGIGLALAKRIIEVHGGRIWVESEGAGHGSTFCFTIRTNPEFP